ncbi:hypothetical protein [Pantoea agglomerans]|uniref:hypothetical protein n=1 Tax=Enterobacter agglomerans TaxID=549 RepID=UPI00320A9124
MKKKASLYSEALAVTGSLCAIIATVFAIYVYYNPITPTSQRYDSMVGSWLSDYSYTVKGNTVRINGKTTFFSNGKYNFHGSISINSYALGDHIFIDYLSDGAGDWELNDSELITSLNSLKTKPIKLVLNNEDLNPLKLEMINNRKLPTIEENMANGKSQAYKILTSTNNRLILEVINEIGSNFELNMQKTK